MDNLWICLVVWNPLKKIRVRQLGWWNSQLNGKIKDVPNHQPVLDFRISLFRSCLGSKKKRIIDHSRNRSVYYVTMNKWLMVDYSVFQFISALTWRVGRNGFIQTDKNSQTDWKVIYRYSSINLCIIWGVLWLFLSNTMLQPQQAVVFPHKQLV